MKHGNIALLIMVILFMILSLFKIVSYANVFCVCLFYLLIILVIPDD